MISIKKLKKVFPNVTPLEDVSVEIAQGEVISLIDPSGTGKSTLLRCLNLLETPTSGEIWIDGQNIMEKGVDVPAVRRKMGMVFQSFNLFSQLTVIENIMLGPLNLLKLSKQEAYDEGMRLLEMVGLAEKSLNYPSELSGGQKQRVAIARALAMKPQILLFDEPTSALDPTMVGEVLSVIRSLTKEGLTMIIVTHEMKFARDVSTRVFYMDEGGIYEDGTPEQIFDNPLKEKTRIFAKRLKSFELVIESASFDFIGASTALEEFGRKQQFEQRQLNTIQLVFEELCVQTLLKQSVFPIKFSAFVSEVDDSCVTKISYGGPTFDPFTSQNDELSIVLISKLVKSCNHSYADATNVLDISLK